VKACLRTHGEVRDFDRPTVSVRCRIHFWLLRCKTV